MADGLFDKPTIVLALGAVAARLEAQGAEPGVLIVVGGSFMALHELREATRDIDTVTRITAAIRAALDAVAAEHGFEADWLNDRAVIYVPQGLVEEACEVLFDHPRLRVLGPPADYVFVMNLYAARGEVDHDDMVRLWPRCTFTTPGEAVALYWEGVPARTRGRRPRRLRRANRERSHPPRTLTARRTRRTAPRITAPRRMVTSCFDGNQRSRIAPFTTNARTRTGDRESGRTTHNANRTSCGRRLARRVA